VKYTGFAPPDASLPAREDVSSHELYDDFTDPLVKLMTANKSTPTDLTKLLQSIPELLVSIPGVGNLDVNKLPPWMVEHVLRGGQLPGVKKETLDAIVRQYMQRVYVAALHELGREPAPEEKLPPLPKGVDPKSYLRPVMELPQRFVTSVLQGHPLPYLSKKQTQVIKVGELCGVVGEWFVRAISSGLLREGHAHTGEDVRFEWLH